MGEVNEKIPLHRKILIVFGDKFRFKSRLFGLDVFVAFFSK